MPREYMVVLPWALYGLTAMGVVFTVLEFTVRARPEVGMQGIAATIMCAMGALLVRAMVTEPGAKAGG